MKRVLVILMMVFGVFLFGGSQGSSTNLKKPIMLGTSSYDLMKATFGVLFRDSPELGGMSFIFHHSYKQAPDKQEFSLSFIGCKDINWEEVKYYREDMLALCNVWKNTKLVTTTSLIENIFNMELSHPSHGIIEFKTEFKAGHLKLESNFDLRNTPSIDQYKKINANISLSDMSVVFEAQNISGEKTSGKAFVMDDKVHIIVNGIEKIFEKTKIFNKQAELLLSKFPTFIEAIYKFKRSIYDFSGMTIHQGEVLKTNIFSVYNKIYPLLLKGFKVDGESLYRGREVAVMTPIVNLDIDLDHLVNNQKETLQFLHALSPRVGDITMYVDKDTGTLVYLDLPIDISLGDFKPELAKRYGKGIGKIKVFINTEFPPTNPTKKLSLQEAKNECAVIGFKIGTEKFGNCVMKLMD